MHGFCLQTGWPRGRGLGEHGAEWSRSPMQEGLAAQACLGNMEPRSTTQAGWPRRCVSGSMGPRSTTQAGKPRRCGLGHHAAEEHDAGGQAT